MEREQIIELLSSHRAVLIPLNEKTPIQKAWQQITESHPEALSAKSDKNIGVVLGTPSGGLVDVDIDDMDALALADIFLPNTGMQFGRRSKPRSHRIYRCNSPAKTKRLQGRNGVIVELRGNGAQTMFPPSTHPSGELVEFSGAREPANADWIDLEGDIVELAIATGIAPFYREGCRHEIAYVLSGFLRRCEWSKQRTTQFIERLSKAFRDNDVEDRVQAAEDAYAAAYPMGRAKLIDLTDDEFVASASKWAGYRPEASSSLSLGFGGLESEADCANEFVTEHADRVIFDDLADQFYVRRHGVYVPVSDDVIRGLVQDMPEVLASKFPSSSLRKFRTANGVRNIVNMARPQLIADARNFDSDHTLLGVQNGVLDLTTKTLLADPVSVVTKRASARYTPDADCPSFKAFLREIMGNDEELIGYVRRVLGYCMTGFTGEQACFFAIGCGANGKSTLFSVLHSVLGDYAGDTPMHTLMQTKYGDQNTYDLAALEGKRLVIAQEGEATSKLAEAKLKFMTGGDAISCRPIYGKPKTYDPRFKIILVTNDLPKIEGVEEAIWRRIKIIPFNVTIPPEQRDPYLKEKLLGERDGILSFLLDCFQEYDAARASHKAGSGLSEPQIVIKEIEKYRSEADSVGMFIRLNCIVDDSTKKTSSMKLYKAYEAWCEEGGIEPLTQAYFGRNLGKKGYQKYRMSSGNAWKGVALRNEQMESHTNANVKLSHSDLDAIFQFDC